MAESDNANTRATQGDRNNEQQGPKFALERVYLKDASFESPKSPGVFSGKWNPKTSVNLSAKNSRVADGVHEVILTLTIDAKQEDNTAFLIEVQQAGVFACSGFSEEDLERVLATVCPNILFPYARETIDSMVVRGNFPPVLLAPVNFEALYQQSKQQAGQVTGDSETVTAGTAAAGQPDQSSPGKPD